MFAKDFPTAVHVHTQLANDPLIGPQGIVVREYIPLRTFALGPQDLPITNEWRVFCYRDQIVDYGYYWASHLEFAVDGAEAFQAGGLALVKELMPLFAENVPFFVLDVGEKATGGWVLVEANDAQQSGLAGIDPYGFYGKLRGVLSK